MTILIQAEKLASGFLALGLKKGDRVGIWGPNIEEWILTQFATAKAGLILVQLALVYMFQMKAIYFPWYNPILNSTFYYVLLS